GQPGAGITRPAGRRVRRADRVRRPIRRSSFRRTCPAPPAMREPTVVITDLYATYPAEAVEVLERAGVAIINAEASSTDAMKAILEGDGLIVGWFPMTAEVIAKLSR